MDREGGENRFGIACRPECEAPVGEIFPKRNVIVDFPIEGDRIAALAAGHRLVAPAKVQYAEPAHPKTEIAIDQNPRVIGPAMADGIALCRDQFPADGASTSSIPPRYTAHSAVPPFADALAAAYPHMADN